MKRLIALLLAVCLCCAVPAMADTSVSLYQEQGEAYKFLNSLGIVESISENQAIYFETPANRGDFVRYAMLLGGYDVSNMDYTHSFYNDVSVSDENFKYISCAYELGYVSGKGDHMFHPDDTISYSEAVKILTCVLGADKIAKSLGGYPAGYVLAASKLGIKQNSVSNANALTNGDVIALLYDALFAHTAHDNGVETVVDNSNEGVVLEKCHGVYKYSGVVKSAGGVAITLDSGIETERDEFIIDKTKFRYASDTQGFLGMYADVYYKTKDGIAIALYVDISDNEVTVIESEDFVSSKDSVIEYTETNINFETTYKSKEIKLSSKTDVVYNGKPYPFYDDNLFDLSKTNGSIRCISSSKGGSADVVIVEAYSNYVVASVDRMDKLIYSKLPKETLDFSKCSDVEIFDAYGNARTFEDIFAADVVSVMKSVDGKYAKIIASSSRENRKVIEILDDNKVVLDNHKTASFDFIAKEKAKNELLIGRLIDICYDYKGRICDFVYNAEYEDGIDYGYLVRVASNTSGFSNDVKVKLFRLTNVMEEYFVADKLNLDGDKVSNKEVYNRFVLTDSSNGVEYTDMQMVKFSVNKETGKINFIDSKYKGSREGEESLTSITHDKTYFIMDIGALEGLNAFEKGYFLSIPMPDSTLTPSAVNDIPDYLFTSEESIINAGDISGTFEVVDADAAGWASLMIHRPKWKPVGQSADTLEGVAKGEGTVYMVDSFSYVLDDDGNEVVKLTYYNSSGEKKSNLVRNKNLVKVAVTKNGTTTYEDMEKGDLFSCDIDKENYIYSTSICLNLSNITNDKFIKTTLEELSGRVCGPAYGVSDQGLSLLCTVKEGEVPDFSTGAYYEEIFDLDTRYTRTLGNNFSKVVVYDVKEETVTKGTLDDIITCDTDGYCPSILYARVSLGRITYTYVINNYR